MSGGGKELRKDIEAGVKAALASRSFTRLRDKQRFVSEQWVEAPLQALLLVGIDTDRYGKVRVGGSAMVLAPAVEDLLADSVPRSAVTGAQEVYYGRLPFGMAGTSFKQLVDPQGQVQLTWEARTAEQGVAAIEGFLSCVDGPVRQWFEDHSTIDRIRASVRAGGDRQGDGRYVRSVAALEALQGDLDAAVALLEAYRPGPQESDSDERVQEFIDWLRQAVPGSTSRG